MQHRFFLIFLAAWAAVPVLAAPPGQPGDARPPLPGMGVEQSEPAEDGTTESYADSNDGEAVPENGGADPAPMPSLGEEWSGPGAQDQEIVE